MEEKINVAEILKDKPQGTKLYSILSDGECFLNEAFEDSIYIDIDNGKRFWRLSAYGSTHSFPNGCVLLFPSKEMRDWSKFAWKKGDVLVCKDDNSHIIFEKFNDDTYATFTGKLYYQATRAGYSYTHTRNLAMTQDFDIEEGDAVQTYIKTIEEKLGGKLNLDTLEIEKIQAEFKDGDVAAVDEIPFDLYSKCIFILKENLNTGEIKARAYVLYNVNKDSIYFDTPVMKVIERNIHLATDEEKQQLFDALEKEGKVWDAEKKAIVVKPKVELKPFDKVLCRNSKDDTWEADFFARLTRKEIDYTQSGKYLCVGDLWMYCIPYNEETAHLLGTTDEWKGGEG